MAGVLAGCGGSGGDGPRLARADVAPLIALADRIASEGPCAQAHDIRRLEQRRLALVRVRRVPAALLEPFSSGVNALSEQTPPCLPAVAAAAPSPPPPPPPPAAAPPPTAEHKEHKEHKGEKREHEQHRDKPHGHGHGHGDEGGGD